MIMPAQTTPLPIWASCRSRSRSRGRSARKRIEPDRSVSLSPPGRMPASRSALPAASPESHFVDAERLQEPRQFICGVKSLANQRIEIRGRDAEFLRDACKFTAVELANLADIPPVLEPVTEYIDGLFDH